MSDNQNESPSFVYILPASYITDERQQYTLLHLSKPDELAPLCTWYSNSKFWSLAGEEHLKDKLGRGQNICNICSHKARIAEQLRNFWSLPPEKQDDFRKSNGIYSRVVWGNEEEEG